MFAQRIHAYACDKNSEESRHRRRRPSTYGSCPVEHRRLPAELLNAVADRLDFFATAGLAGVCTSWARSVASIPSLPLGMPCLLKSREEGRSDLGNRDGGGTPLFQLLDLTRREEELSFPALIGAMRHRRWLGGKDGWLATVDRSSNASLVNPYTGTQIDLPIFATIRSDFFLSMLLPSTRWNRWFRRIIVCDTPSSGAGGRYLVIAMVRRDILAVARGGSASWTELKNPNDDPAHAIDYTDAIVHKGKVCAVTSHGYTLAVACSPEMVLPPPHHDHDRSKRENHWNLAESADGRRVLIVCTYGSQVEYRRLCGMNTYSQGRRFQAQGVRLFERDMGGGDDGGWMPVAGLGDHSLFLGASYPFMARVVDRGLSSSSDSGCREQQLIRANCVCVTAENRLNQGQDLEYDMEVFDLGSGKYWDHPRKHFSAFSRYCNYQTPMWFRPTLKYSQGQAATEEFRSKD